MGRKLIKAAESAIFELQSKYEGLKILLYNNVERNQYEIIVDVEKYGLDDEFLSDLAETVREKTNPNGFGIYTYFVNDFDEKKKAQENMKIRGKISTFFRPVTATLSDLRMKYLIWKYRKNLVITKNRTENIKII